MTGLDPGVAPVATVVTGAAAGALAWHQLGADPGVDYKLLWQSGKSVAGLLRIAPGAELTPHAHVRSHHHLWVTEGSAEVLGQIVGPGTYVHIPARIDHGIRASGDQACTMLYLYLRDEPTGAN